MDGVIPLWKMYWSSWKNRSERERERERERSTGKNFGVRGTGALACG